MAIDGTGLPLPTMVGFANRCVIVDRGDYAELSFFEDRPGVADLLDIIGVCRLYVPIDDLLLQIWQGSKVMLASLRRSFPDRSADRQQDAARTEDPGRNGDLGTALSTNFLAIARHGLDATFSFYYLTPRSVFRHQERHVKKPLTQDDLEIVPVACVQSGARLVLDFLEELERRSARHSITTATDAGLS